eukprot:762122_1
MSATSYWQVSNDVLAWNWRMAGGVYNDSIYLIGGSNDKKSVKQYQWTTHASISVGKWGCLASQNGSLYVIGGYNSDSLNRVQILTVSTLQWTTNAPVMKQARSDLSCIATNNYLWAFGGSDATLNKINITNERIHMKKIMQN